MTKKSDLSHEDKKAWEEYIKNPSNIYDKDKTGLEKKAEKNRFKFDLHGFTLNDANKKVKDIINFCIEKKYKEILFITGKGTHSSNEKDVYVSRDLSKLQFSVPEYINSSPELRNLINSINEAHVKDGGQGAILVKLKNL